MLDETTKAKCLHDARWLLASRDPLGNLVTVLENYARAEAELRALKAEREPVRPGMKRALRRPKLVAAR